MSSRLRRIAVATGFVLTCLAVAWSVAALIAYIRIVRIAKAARASSIADGPVPAVRAAIPALVRRTRFEDRWAVNGDYRRNRLSVYLVRFTPTTPQVLTPFRDNCSAVSAWDLVVCDAALLDTFLDRRGVFAGLARERVASARAAFVDWTIGHEIAHVLRGDGPAHYAPSALDAQIARASHSHRQELAADAFIVRQIAADADRRLAVENLALDLLNSEIRGAVGAQNLPAGAGPIFDYTNEHVVRYLDRGTHPEYFVRAARILEAAGELPGNEPLRAMVRPLIEHIGGGRT